MSITLDDVLSLLRIFIKGILLNYYILIIPDAMDMMVQYLGVDPGDMPNRR